MKLLFIFSVLLLQVSPKKTLNTAEDYRIKKFTKGQSTTSYQYTPEKRVASLYNSKGISISYEYFSAKIIKYFFDSTTGQRQIDTILIDRSGLAYKIGPNEMKYDSNGFLVNSKMVNNGRTVMTTEFLIEGGNQKSARYLDEYGKVMHTVYYKYYEDKPNTISNENMGIKYLGKSAAKLIKEIMLVKSGSDTSRTQIYYSFDDNNRVRCRVEKQESSTKTDSTLYSYY
jgi:hypothetical protein